MSPFLHSWQADLMANTSSWPAAETSLSLAELVRLAQLRTPLLRQTYVCAHGFLRSIPGQHTGQPPAALELTLDANGKPIIAAHDLSFNLSYRAGRALLALSNAGSVGDDLKPLLPLRDAAPLVTDLFSPPEQAALHAATPADY